MGDRSIAVPFRGKDDASEILNLDILMLLLH